MKILYISQYFPPEMGAPAGRVFELSRHWVRAGHDVTVLTGFPNHPTGVVPPAYRAKMRRLVSREEVEGIRVVRTWLWPLPNRRALERILSFASFCLSSGLVGIFLRRPDVVIATSPQLLVGLTGWWVSRIKRVPLVFEVRDLWPESITVSPVARSSAGSVVTRLLGALCHFLYRSSEHVVAVTTPIKEKLIDEWAVRPEKISVVPNAVETDFFTPDGATEAAGAGPQANGEFVVSYMGTMGLAHGLGTALQAAAELRQEYPDILFQFVGEGAEKESLLSQAEAMGVSNVRFVSQQPRDSMPALIRSSDLCLVLLRKVDVFRTVIPSKLLEFMACGRPVILGVDGEARRIVDEAQAGVFVQPEDSAALGRAVVQLYRDSEARRTMGRNGRSYVAEYFSRARTAKEYLNVLESVSVNGRRRTARTD